MPTVSVLMSVYNAAHYLREAVESILRQTFTNLEVIIIDDGSTDASGAILDACARRDPRIHLIRRPNKGLTRSLNEGLALARGTFVARMDADDVALPERIERQVGYLQNHPECVAVGSRMLMLDPDGEPVGPFETPVEHEAIDQYNLTWGGGGIPHPTAMIRRDALDRIGGYREEFPVAQDGDLFLRLAEVGRLANLPEILLQYRLHLSSISTQLRAKQIHFGRLSIREACQRRGIPIPDHGVLYREGEDSPVDQQRQWACSALAAGYHRTARKHAWSVVQQAYWVEQNWWLLGAALFPPKTILKQGGCLSAWGRTLGRWAVVASGTLFARVARYHVFTMY